MKKCLLTLLSFLIIFMPISVIPNANADQSFIDVPREHWAYDAIQYMANMGIITGYPDGTFRPEKPILRQEMAIITYKIFSFDGLHPDKPTFQDVPSPHWAYPIIETIATSKLMEDTTFHQKFRPEEALERIEYVPLQCRILGMKYFSQHISTEITTEILSRYTDASLIPDWAKRYLAILTESKAIGGFPDGTFRPFQPLTRAQICVSLAKMLKPLGPNEPISSPARFNVLVNGATLTPFLSTNLEGSILHFRGNTDPQGYVALMVNGVPFMPMKAEKDGAYLLQIPIGIITIGGITIQAKYYEQDSLVVKHSFQAYSSVPFDLFPNAYRLHALEYYPLTRVLSYVSETSGGLLIGIHNTTTNKKEDIVPKAGTPFYLTSQLISGGNHVNLMISNKENSFNLIYGFDFNSN